VQRAVFLATCDLSGALRLQAAPAGTREELLAACPSPTDPKGPGISAPRAVNEAQCPWCTKNNMYAFRRVATLLRSRPSRGGMRDYLQAFFLDAPIDCALMRGLHDKYRRFQVCVLPACQHFMSTPTFRPVQSLNEGGGLRKKASLVCKKC